MGEIFMADTNGRKLKVFLCHAAQDKPVVRALYARLLAEGWIDPWLDEEKLYPGQDWDMEIEKAVEETHTVIVCLSNNAVTKEGYIQRELRLVLNMADYKPEGTLFIIPIRVDECPLPRRLKMWHYVDFYPAERGDWAYERLLVSLHTRAEKLGIGTTKPAAPAQTQAARPLNPPVVLHQKEKPAASPDRLMIGEMEFCRIPAGTFLMGSADSDKQAFKNEKPQHTLDIPYDYWMARFPVTNAQYAAYLGDKQHPVKDWAQKRDHPVTHVSWEDAMRYCRWLNEQFQEQLPADLLLRLPSEAEWEKAAHGADGRLYPWGNQFDPHKCNTREGGKNGTTPVGAYSPQGDSPYGCAEMSGNVWEWTHSLRKPYPYQPRDGREDEQAAGRRVLRGGSFLYYARVARCAYRDDGPFDLFGDYNGFRVVASVSLL